MAPVFQIIHRFAEKLSTSLVNAAVIQQNETQRLFRHGVRNAILKLTLFGCLAGVCTHASGVIFRMLLHMKDVPPDKASLHPWGIPLHLEQPSLWFLMALLEARLWPQSASEEDLHPGVGKIGAWRATHGKVVEPRRPSPRGLFEETIRMGCPE